MPTVSELISQILLKKLRDEELSPQELATLAEWENRSPEHKAFIVMLMNEAGLSDKIKTMLEMDEQNSWERIERALEVEWNERAIPAKRKISAYKYAAATAAVAVIGFAIYFFSNTQPPVNETTQVAQPDSVDFAPGGKKASLTLSNGSVIDLEPKHNGLLVDNEGAKVTKTGDGKLLYEKSALTFNSSHNILSTPLGGHYQVQLIDGTKVWLNAASSIKFPVNFSSLPERTVEVMGEVFFEVSRDPRRKFVVLVNSSRGNRLGEVQVLGTHFNIMAYDEENIVTTTVTGGRVKMMAYSAVGGNSRSLLPGQQATLDEKGALTVKKNVDTTSVTAWKNEDFNFESDNLALMLREISRWYNVKIFYKGALPKSTFTGILSRNQKLSQILQVLESANLHFELKGDSLTILP